MKSILMSIKPKWIEKIARGEKTVEVRKSVPKCGAPFKVYMYCTKEGKGRNLRLHINDKKGREDVGMTTWWRDGKDVLKVNDHLPAYRFNSYLAEGKVVGEFVCDEVYNFIQAGAGIMFADKELNQLDPQDARDMTCLTDKEFDDYLGNKDGYGLHISDLKIYDKPKELSEFHYPCTYPNNSCYDCAIERLKPHCHYAGVLERPPQSWQFVEEL